MSIASKIIDLTSELAEHAVDGKVEIVLPQRAYLLLGAEFRIPHIPREITINAPLSVTVKLDPEDSIAKAMRGRYMKVSIGLMPDEKKLPAEPDAEDRLREARLHLHTLLLHLEHRCGCNFNAECAEALKKDAAEARAWLGPDANP